MKKIFSLAVLAVSSCFVVSAQEIKKSKYKISQFQLSFGGDRSLAPLNINQNEFNVLAPGAQIPLNSTPYTTQLGNECPLDECRRRMSSTILIGVNRKY